MVYNLVNIFLAEFYNPFSFLLLIIKHYLYSYLIRCLFPDWLFFTDPVFYLLCKHEHNCLSDILTIVIFLGLPILFVGPWVLVRIFLEDTLCWTTNDNPIYFQLIKGPTTVSILVITNVLIKISCTN